MSSSGITRQKTYPELAQDALLNSDPEKFINSIFPTIDNYLLEVTLFYFQALGSIMGKLYTRKKTSVSYTMEQMDTFNKNKTTLEGVLLEIEDLSLNQLLSKYNEAVIISGLVYSIRQCEASIKNFNKYLNLKEKFISWPKVGIKSIRVLDAWKDFDRSLTELEQWLIDKQLYFMPPVENMVREYENNQKATSSETFYLIMKKFIKNDKEIFYGIANILITNPLLYLEILNLSQMENNDYLEFEKLVFGILEFLNRDDYNPMLNNMIDLFTKQVKYERPDIYLSQ